MAKEYQVNTKKVGKSGRWTTIEIDGLYVTIYTFGTRRPSVHVQDTKATMTKIEAPDDEFQAVNIDFA